MYLIGLVQAESDSYPSLAYAYESVSRINISSLLSPVSRGAELPTLSLSFADRVCARVYKHLCTPYAPPELRPRGALFSQNDNGYDIGASFFPGPEKANHFYRSPMETVRT